MAILAWLFSVLCEAIEQCQALMTGGKSVHGYRGTRRALHPRHQRKPAWVVAELIRLKALMPDAGCRHIADSFNRRFGESRGMTVGKTFVSETIRQNLNSIQRLRLHLKHRRPRPMPINRIWAIDLTGKGDAQGARHALLGIVDHGSRACLLLQRIRDRSSLGLVLKIATTVHQYGCPRVIRTDNEAIFTSRTFRAGLALMGIRHQRTQVACPWQNGRIERFFGTLKSKLDRWIVKDAAQLDTSLRLFRFWYNHVRPHRHLDGATPAEVWSRPGKGRRHEQWFEAWDGLLAGYYAPA